MALLDHPHIVRVFDQRQLADRQLRLLYMQYIPGGTLQTRDRHDSPAPAQHAFGRTLARGDRRVPSIMRGEVPPDRFAAAASVGDGRLAANGVLAGIAAGGGAGLCASAGRVAP